MRVLLVYPPPPRPGRAGLVVPPLGLGFLAAMLRRRGHRVWIRDLRLSRQPWRALDRAVGRFRPEVLGVQVLTSLRRPAARVVARSRARVRWCCAGGAHPTAVGEAVFGEMPGLDLSVEGEGEYAFPAALAWLEGGAGGAPPPGVRVPGRPFRPPERTTDLDALPWPAHDLFPRGVYRHPLATSSRFASILSSRGCPGRCIYCDQGVAGRSWRGRSPHDVRAEMRWLHHRQGVRFVALYDDAFATRPERVHRLCRALERDGLDLRWKCEVRPEQMSPPLARSLVAGGCSLVAMGVESAHPPSLRWLGRPGDPATVDRAFRTARRAGLRTLAYVLVGLPGEGPREVAETLRFCLDLGADHVQFSTLQVFPGTPLAGAARRGEVRRIPRGARNPFDVDECREVVSDLSARELRASMRRAWGAFYLRPSALARLGADLLRSGVWLPPAPRV